MRPWNCLFGIATALPGCVLAAMPPGLCSRRQGKGLSPGFMSVSLATTAGLLGGAGLAGTVPDRGEVTVGTGGESQEESRDNGAS